MLSQEKLDQLFAGFQKTKDKVIDTILKQVPDDVAEHLGNSEKELLLALRSVIDKSIDRVDAGVEKVKQAKCCDSPCCDESDECCSGDETNPEKRCCK